MVVRNDMDRFHLVEDVIDRVPNLAARAAAAKEMIRESLARHQLYIGKFGEDMPEIRDWRWNATPDSQHRSRPDTAADF